MTDGANLFSVIVSGQFAAAAALILIFIASRMILKSIALPFLVVLPLAVLVPWRVPGGEYVAGFTLASAAIWLSWLYALRAANARRAMCAMTATVTVAAFLSTQSLLVTAAAAAWLALRPLPGMRQYHAAALILVPVAVLGLLTLPVEPPLLSPARWASSLHSAFTNAWSADNWCSATQNENFLGMHLAFSQWFYWPMLLPIALLVYVSRSQWWAEPTALLSATLAAGALLLGGEHDLFNSLPLQAALIVPGGLAGLWQMNSADALRDAPEIRKT